MDENIPFATQAFKTLGQVTLVPGREIDPATISDAQSLIVRSVTQVNKKLLEKSPIRFVGTATTGLDHIDQCYLKENNIAFASSLGANANSVAEYVITALLITAKKQGLSLKGKTLGIVGVGNIGNQLNQKATALGMQTILNDPPLARKTNDPCYRPFQETLEADFLSFHVPLNHEGQDPSYHLLDEAVIAKLNPATTIINTSRGEVIDNQAILKALEQKKIAAPILDVWEGEPAIDSELLKEVAIGTPHIAGYSWDGKIKATGIIYEALSQHLGLEPTWSPESLNPKTQKIDTTGMEFLELLCTIATLSYDLIDDDRRLRETLKLPIEKRPAAFDRLRKEYPTRHEFHHTTVVVNPTHKTLAEQIKTLGFQVL